MIGWGARFFKSRRQGKWRTRKNEQNLKIYIRTSIYTEYSTPCDVSEMLAILVLFTTTTVCLSSIYEDLLLWIMAVPTSWSPNRRFFQFWKRRCYHFDIIIFYRWSCCSFSLWSTLYACITARLLRLYYVTFRCTLFPNINPL